MRILTIAALPLFLLPASLLAEQEASTEQPETWTDDYLLSKDFMEEIEANASCVSAAVALVGHEMFYGDDEFGVTKYAIEDDWWKAWAEEGRLYEMNFELDGLYDEKLLGETLYAIFEWDLELYELIEKKRAVFPAPHVKLMNERAAAKFSVGIGFNMNGPVEMLHDKVQDCREHGLEMVARNDT